MDFVLGGWIVGEGVDIRGEVLVVLGRGAVVEFFELAMGAAEAVVFAHGWKATVAAIGIGKFAEVEVGVGSFRRHGWSIRRVYNRV